ncbi:MAG TPA: intein-containing recombinase RecA, partial [Galbitalea sp.]|nr:intein-containing recombinase RecA [Galbitalea sp.]
PFKQAEFDILYGTGISREGSLIDFGVDHEIVRKSGAWYTYDGDQLGQGKENSRKFLLDNPAIALDIEQKIMFKLGVGAEAKAAKATAAAEALQAQNKADAKAAKAPAGPKPIEVVPTAVAEEEFPPASAFEESLKAVGE